jgi:hypothetical protein
MNQTMKVEKKSNLALLLVLALCMSQPLITNAWKLLFPNIWKLPIPDEWKTPKYFVHIENNLSNQTLQAHCKSGDQDLGPQHIYVLEEFHWGFYVNFWGTTLYFCNMSWPGGHKTFDVFWSSISFIYDKCSTSTPYYKNQSNYMDCVWRVKDEGIYLFDFKTQEYHFQYKWEHR